MPIITEQYDPVKIDKLRHYINTNAEKENPKDYEIFVDSLKVVPRTNNADEFDNFEEYVSEDTQRIRILIYNSPNSPRNDQHVFILKEKKEKKEELNGVDIKSTIAERVQEERERWETAQVKKDNESLQLKLKEAEEYIEKLEAAYEQEKGKKFQLGNINIGELSSIALEGFIRRNPQLLAKILPGGEALAGVIEQDTKEKEKALLAPAPETEATFKPKEASQAISETDRQYIAFMKQLDERFTDEEMQGVMLILNRFSKDASLIKTVIELINNPNEKEEQNETNL